MARACKCCAKEIMGNKCTYCNYLNIELLDDSGVVQERERAKNYKENLLSRLTDFTINAYTYKWNSTISKLENGRSKIIIADSIDSFDKIIWCEKSFGQNINDNQNERPLNISYKVNGKEKVLNALLKTIKCEDFWKLGVMINHDLTVSFYLGTKSNHVISGPFDLDFN